MSPPATENIYLPKTAVLDRVVGELRMALGHDAVVL